MSKDCAGSKKGQPRTPDQVAHVRRTWQPRQWRPQATVGSREAALGRPGDCINPRGAQRGDPAWTLCSQKQAFPEASALQTSHVPLLRSLTAITAVTGEELTYNDVHGSMNFYTGTYLWNHPDDGSVLSTQKSRL